MTGTIAGCFALAAFAVAVVAGLAGGNPSASILLRALSAMIACYPIGLVIGMVCQHVVREHLAAEARAEEVAEAARQSAQSAKEAEDVMVV